METSPQTVFPYFFEFSQTFSKKDVFFYLFLSPDSSLNFGSNATVRIFSGNSLRYSLTRLATASGSYSWRSTDFPSNEKKKLKVYQDV